jgi:hypothetical protein
VEISIHRRSTGFLPGELVYDSDEDRTDSGNAAGNEDDPEIGTTGISYVHGN